MKKRFYVILCFVFLCFSASAQISLSGRVTDAAGNALEGASVAVKGSSIGTLTKADGTFSLSDVPSQKSILIFSSVGFATEQFSVEDRRIFNIQLANAQSSLDSVVVIGYGVAKKAEFTGSATQIQPGIIEAQSNSTVTRALEGAVPGLQVSSIDGQPGLDMGIRLRGVSSTSQNAANALIVIDNVIAEYPNALSSINPKDIASISVLKDAASTAIYGSRGANGVVLVTTKKGKNGPAKISLSTRMGYNYLSPDMKPDLVMNAKDYYEYAWQAIYNSVRYGVDGTSSTAGTYTTNVKNPNMSDAEAGLFASQHLFDYNGSLTSFSQNSLGNWLLYSVPGMNFTPTGSGTNASSTLSGAYLVNPDGKLNPDAKLLFPGGSYDNTFFNKPFRQEHNLSASGGSDRMDYFVSLGVLQDPSYITGSKFRRYSARTNINAQLTPWLKVGENSSFSQRETESPATRFGRNPGAVAQNVFRWIQATNPLVSLYNRDANGNIIRDASGNPVVVDGPGVFQSPVGPTTGANYSQNLPMLLARDKDNTSSYDLDLSGYATITFLKDFSFTGNMSFQRFADDRLRYGNMTTGAVQGIGATARYENNTNVFNTQQLLNWGHTYGKNTVSAIAGHEYYSYETNSMVWTGAYSLVPDFTGSGNFTSHYNTAGAPFGGPSAGGDLTTMESYFGRANYNYDSKYFLEASARRDGSSKFRYVGDRWGTFWSVGAGWLMTAEKFMDGTRDWLNSLKVRASYGVIGNQSGIGNYSEYQTWTLSANYTTAANGQGIPATLPNGAYNYNLVQGIVPNTTLTWENTHTFDAGIDFTLWKSRINGSIDFYNKLTVNSVFDRPLAFSLGQSSVTVNGAELQNRGVEVDLNIDVIRNQDFRWNVGINGTHYRTILKSIPSGVGVPQLNGDFTGAGDGWAKSGNGTTGGNIEYLRGVGMDWFNMYLFKYKGVDQETGLPLFQHTVTDADHDANLFSSDAVGSYVNTTNYTLADRYSMGSALPKWIGGFTTNLYYKNFDLGVILAYQLGGKFLSVSYANGFYRSGQLGNGNAISSELLHNTWTPENPNAKFPMVFFNGDDQFTSGATIGSWAYSDMSLFSASYLNLKNITLGYTFKDVFLRKLSITSLRVYGSADNVAFATSHSGIDPRLSLVGGMEVGAAYYLPMSTVSFGIDLTF